MTRQKAWQVARARGVPTAPVPVGPVREHVLSLRGAHVSQRAIARAAGCSATLVRDIERAKYSRVCRGPAARLMRLSVADVVASRELPKDRVPAIGAVRRVRALLALGHSHATITTAGGPGWNSGDVTRDPDRQWTFLAVHEAATRAYGALSMCPGTNGLVRARAAAAGYLPPLCWDEEDLDDPAAVPHLARRHNEHLDLDEFMWLVDAGEAPARAALRCGVSVAGVERAARRCTPARSDVLDALAGVRAAERRAA